MKRLTILLIVLACAFGLQAQLPRVYGPTDKPAYFYIYQNAPQHGDTIFSYVTADKNYITGKFLWPDRNGMIHICWGPVSGGTPQGGDDPVRTGAEYGEQIHLGIARDGQLYELKLDKIRTYEDARKGIKNWLPPDKVTYAPIQIYIVDSLKVADQLNITLAEVPVWQSIRPPEPEPEPETVTLADFDLLSYKDNSLAIGIKDNKVAIQNLSDEHIKFKFGRGWRNVQGGLESGAFKVFGNANIFTGMLTLKYTCKGMEISETFRLK